MLPISINGVNKNLPTEWKEVSVKKFRSLSQTLIDVVDVKPFHLLSALLEIDYNILINEDVTTFSKLIPAIKFIEIPFNERVVAVPDEIIIDSLNVKVPKDMKKELAGQYWDSYTLQESAREKPLVMIASELGAYYLQPNYTQAKYAKENIAKEAEYNDKEVDALKDILDQMPITTILPVASFFLIKFYKLEPLKARH